MTEKSLLAAVQEAARPGYAELTVVGLRENRPDLISAVEATHDVSARLASARAEGETAGKLVGANAERERLAGIDKLMPVGMEKLRDELRADVSVTPEKAAVRFLEAGNAATSARLQGLKDADVKNGVAAAPVGDLNDRRPADKAEADKTDDDFKAEYAAGPKDINKSVTSEATYVSLRRAEVAGKVKSLTGRTAA